MGAQNRRLSTIRTINDKEIERQNIQVHIDTQKSIDDRRQLGQFATPISLSEEIVSYGLSLLVDSNIRFLEPALGTGSFFSALLRKKSKRELQLAIGYEVDPMFGKAAKAIWNDDIEVRISDFTDAEKDATSVNLLITNPPYVRHHYISQTDKIRLSAKIKKMLNINISGMSGLYCYFVLLSHEWLEENAISGWLIPSEFMDVNYGKELKRYLLDNVQLLRIHRYNPENVLFDDALVTSCVVWFRNIKNDEDYDIQISFGGTHENPEQLKQIKKSVLLNENKWSRFPGKEERVLNNKQCRIKDFFHVKRGLATGDNDFFILTKEQIISNALDFIHFKPILPSPRYLTVDYIESDNHDFPILKESNFLLSCFLSEKEIQEQYPTLWNYLESGKDKVSQRYLCRSRKKWYFQEKREAAPLLCTYMGRSNNTNSPFRFIRNDSKAVATNSYLMLYPKETLIRNINKDPDLLDKIWVCLNSLSADSLESEGRVYGGGLKKIEPRELGEVYCPDFAKLTI